MIIYAPLWDTMKSKGITTYALINKYNISKLAEQVKTKNKERTREKSKSKEAEL